MESTRDIVLWYGEQPRRIRQTRGRKARRNQIKFMAMKRFSLRSELPGLLVLKLMFQFLDKKVERWKSILPGS